MSGHSLIENKVSLSNLAARNAQGFSLREKRLVAAAISKNNSLKPARTLSYDQRKVKITALEYSETYNISPKIAYRDLKAAADNLFDRYLRYEFITPKGLKERKIRWVGGVTYHHGEGWVEFSFTQEIEPHLFELKKKFTTYKLQQAASLRSIYSWRLFELLQSYNNKKNSGSFIISLADFNQSLEIPDTYRFANIRQRCIEPAIRELREKDDIIVDYETIKNRRSVDKLSFSWHRDSQEKHPLSTSNKAG